MTVMRKQSLWLALVACCGWLCAGCGGPTPKDEKAKPAAAAKQATTDKSAAPKAAATAATPKEEQPRSPSEEIPPPSTAAASLPAKTTVAAEKSHPPAADWTATMYVFLLSALIGLGVITRVSRLLHTPLMSLTNAISAIAVIGAITVAGSQHHWFINFLGAVALFASTTNIVSGFLITDRMLKMFKKQEPRP
jgi:proton-translocating NAD(P)+ transhydrogenase subunit alpha